MSGQASTWAERVRRLVGRLRASIAAVLAAPEASPQSFVDDEFMQLRGDLADACRHYQDAVSGLCSFRFPEPRDAGLEPIDIVRRERAALGKALDRLDVAITDRTEDRWW